MRYCYRISATGLLANNEVHFDSRGGVFTGNGYDYKKSSGREGDMCLFLNWGLAMDMVAGGSVEIPIHLVILVHRFCLIIYGKAISQPSFFKVPQHFNRC